MPRAADSRALRDFLGSEAVFDRYCGLQGDWVEGHCWRLAAAMHFWAELSGANGHCVVLRRSDTGAPAHAVYRVADCYFDGDGISSGAALLRRWAKHDWPRRSYYIDERPTRADLEATGSLHPDKSLRSLARQLHARFGPIHGLCR